MRTHRVVALLCALLLCCSTVSIARAGWLSDGVIAAWARCYKGIYYVLNGYDRSGWVNASSPAAPDTTAVPAGPLPGADTLTP